MTLPTNQATCEAAGRCTYTAADPSAVPAVAESCSPSATRMVFPNLDDPTKVLNVIFNAFFFDLLAFFAARSPEERKVLEAENRVWRRSVNPITGEPELVKRNTASKRQRVEWTDPETGDTSMVPRSTKRGRERVEWKDLTLTRSAKRSITNSEKKGNLCPCGDKCPACDIQTSKLWMTLPKATEHFVRTGDECGYELADEDVVHYWCQIAPKLSKEMFQANGANERVVCKTCLAFALKRVAEQVGATSIIVPR